MARGATIHRVSLELSDVDRSVYESLSLTVAQHPSETRERMVARVLAFALRYEPGLEFGRGVSSADEPDLWSREGDGRVRQWIEVGQPDGKRLIKAARHAERAVLFAFGAGVERWRSAQLDALRAPENLAVARIDDAFIDTLAAHGERQLRWTLTVSAGSVFVADGHGDLETAPELWLGNALA